MSAVNSVKGVMKTFFWLTREEWQDLDRKFYRLAFGITMFILSAMFWFYFLRNLTNL